MARINIIIADNGYNIIRDGRLYLHFVTAEAAWRAFVALKGVQL